MDVNAAIAEPNRFRKPEPSLAADFVESGERMGGGEPGVPDAGVPLGEPFMSCLLVMTIEKTF